MKKRGRKEDEGEKKMREKKKGWGGWGGGQNART